MFYAPCQLLIESKKTIWYNITLIILTTLTVQYEIFALSWNQILAFQSYIKIISIH